MRPIHPGEILREDFLVPMNMNSGRSRRIEDLRVSLSEAMTADTALRLARYFGTSPEFWLDLQKAYELRVAEHSAPLKADLKSIRPPKTTKGGRAA
jgi:addiction module HigA family antidote